MTSDRRSSISRMSDVMSFRGSFGVENSQPVSIYNLAAEGDEVTLLEILTSDNFDKNQLEILTERLWTPLHVASFHGYRPICQLLLDAGANIHAVTDVGDTALHIAATNGHIGCCSLLLNRIDDHLDVNCLGHQGKTPLHLACLWGRIQTAVILVEQHGADLHIRDDRGTTPLQIVANSSKAEYEIILLEIEAFRKNEAFIKFLVGYHFLHHPYFHEPLDENPHVVIPKQSMDNDMEAVEPIHTPLIICRVFGNEALCRYIMTFI